MRNPINKFFLDAKLLPSLQKAYRQNKALPSIAVGEFLDKDEFMNIKALNMIGWKTIAIPDKRQHDVPSKVTPEEKGSMTFISNFAKKVTGSVPLKQSSMRFKHRDFTILHDKEVQKTGVLAYLFLDDWNAEWGGSVVFTKDGETLGSFVPRANTLLLVERIKGVQSFVKYVNHKAGKRALMILSP